ncbi:Uncharacterized protein PHSC3_000687 [Chlamydiales bacterium STE3]|nr:Uncharacterized protein PHSC3_000687 [Chlamydiales bacterium STE3]
MDSICSKEVSDKALDLFVRWGSSSSEAMLDYPCHYFQIPDCEGIIAYRVEAQTAIVFGNPICAEENLITLVDAFHQYCTASALDVIYMIVDKDFAHLASKKYCKVAIGVCEELIFDPTTFKMSKRLNYRLNQSLKSGLVVHEYHPLDQDIENKILEVGQQWRQARKGFQLHLGHLNFFEHRKGRRWFYVEQGDEMIAMAVLCRIEKNNGWLLKYLISKPSDIPFISEFLMSSLLTRLNQENCNFLTYGVVPAESIHVLKGLNKLTSYFAEVAFQIIKKFFKLDYKKSYWLRYHPKIESSYVLFSKPSIGINGIRALIKSLKND